MKRNIYKGIRRIPTVCTLCGAEWDTKKPGTLCQAVHSINGDFQAPFKVCNGTLKLKPL